MSPKKLTVALVVALALSAVTAAGAFGAATTTPEQWRTVVGGTPTVLTGSQAVTASLSSGAAVFETLLGSTTLKLEATELECVSCTIFNSGGGAKAEGKIELKHITVTPSTCSLSGGVLLSSPLTMDWTYMIGTTAYAEVAPTAGTSFPVFTFTLNGPCAGTYQVVGNFFLQGANATGVYATGQGVSFSKAINNTAGGILKFGPSEAKLSGSAKFEAAGKSFGVE